MRIYLAAHAFRHAEMREVRDRLVAMGHRVTSGWIDTMDEDMERATSDATLGRQADPYRRAALASHEAIRRSDILVEFTGVTGRGGRQVEYGIGLALSQHLVIIGPREHLFHTLACEQYATVDEWLAVLGRADRTLRLVPDA